MGKVIYDFREGLDQEKIVYKKTGWDCLSLIYYLGYMLFTWAFAAAWFALFQYSYINHEPIAFWVYIACWLVFMIVLIYILGRNLYKDHKLNSEKEKKLVAETERNKAIEVKVVQTEMAQLVHENSRHDRL
jgi:type VI protein secretion system component VasK